MSTLYNTNAPKKPTNLTVNSDLLSQAKDYKINLSATVIIGDIFPKNIGLEFPLFW